ncbi:MAG: ABC transporter transmembrane domain-containing protein [Pseudomonadales bacterium]
MADNSNTAQAAEDRPSSRKLQSLRPALQFLRPYLKQVAIASVALVVTAGITLSIGQGLRLLIDAGLAEGSSETLERTLLLFGGLVVLLTIGTFVRFYFVSWVGERVSADIRRAVYDHLLHMHPAFFERNAPTEIQSRITTDTTLLQTVIGSSVSIALRNVLMFFGGLVLLLITNVKLSLIVLVSVPLVVLPVLAFGRRVRSLSRSSQDSLAVVGSYAGESLRNIKVVQGFNHQALDQAAFSDRVEQAFEIARRRIAQRAILVALVMLMVLGAIGVMLWVGGRDVFAGETSGGELAAFIFYAFIVAGSVGAISEVYADLQRAAGAMERLLELLQSPSEIEDPAHPVALQATGSLAIDLQNVTFRYPTRPQVAVLKALSLSVAPGEMVALVGPSGAGKSSLLDLLQRFYEPESGSIYVGGVDLQQLALADLRGQIGFVPQDPVLFGGTLRANLAYGNPAASDLELQRALRAANASAFVEALPDGLDSTVGEGGVGLSGGQRQRLAIARALVTDPRVLLLDEATSALDAESESHIREAILGLKGQRTMLVVAHRLSTVRNADRIVVLSDGEIEAIGTHSQLLERSPLYASFARIQFSEGATAPVDPTAASL